MRILPFAALHPIRSVTAVLTLASVVVGGVIHIDSRYLHKEDMDIYKKRMATVIVSQATSARRQVIEDKLFELDVKKVDVPLTPAESAGYNRYSRELQTLATTSIEERVAELDNSVSPKSNSILDTLSKTTSSSPKDQFAYMGKSLNSTSTSIHSSVSSLSPDQ